MQALVKGRMGEAGYGISSSKQATPAMHRVAEGDARVCSLDVALEPSVKTTSGQLSRSSQRDTGVGELAKPVGRGAE